MKSRSVSVLSILATSLLGCVPGKIERPSVPSLEYAQQFHSNATPSIAGGVGMAAASTPVILAKNDVDPRARIKFVDQDGPAQVQEAGNGSSRDVVSNEDFDMQGVSTFRSTAPLVRDYQGPLALGDPGETASLWKESRGANDMLRDDRAWQSGDLITIVVSEKDQGSRQAKTDTKSETTLAAALGHFFGLSEMFGAKNSTNVTPSALVEGSSKEEFKGEGKTDRQNSLTARMSAMVAEVLPTGILRIEGKKIVAVNDEEQIMIISGLVRTRDINSINEVDSSKIANMRIDYYGKGTVDEAQTPGWGTRLLKNVWPF